jgi:hypothetical protein
MHIERSADIAIITEYILHTAQRLNQENSIHITTDNNAAKLMPIQKDGCSCGVYCAMIADCLTSNINIQLLTPTSIIIERQRMAQNILGQAAPLLTTAHKRTPINPALINTQSNLPPLLHSDYNWMPEFTNTVHKDRMYFVVPTLSHSEIESLRNSYTDPPSHIHIGNRLVPYKDYAELLKPIPVIMSTIDGLMELALQPLNEINFVPTEATYEFSTADRHVYQRLSDITNQWTRLRRELYTKTTVFLFANNKHYTTVISKPDCMTLLHFDSLKPSPTTEPWEIK